METANRDQVVAFRLASHHLSGRLGARSRGAAIAKLRLHLDVNATDREQDEELARLLALGARRVDIGQTGAESWHVLADPEGNEFCLLRRRVPAV